MRRRIGRKRRGNKEGGGEGDCGDEEEEREKDEEMRGRAVDSGISRKVSAVSRRVLGTDRFLDEPRQRNCESMVQNHRGTSYGSRFEEYQGKTRWNFGGSKYFFQTLH